MPKILTKLSCVLLSTISFLQAYDVSGTITFEKIVYSSTAINSGTSNTEPAVGIRVEAFNPNATLTVYASTTTDTSGAFTLSFTETNASLRVKSETTNVDVVPSVGSSSVYGATFATGINEASTGQDHFISEDNASGAFNIAQQVQRGYDFFVDEGHELSASSIEVVWTPTNTDGTFFDQVNKYINIASPNGDPDEFDDDVILHEFGHLAMDYMSRDDSNGGSHPICCGQVNGNDLDPRLAYSEGAATWISCAIRNDNSYLDAGSLEYTIPAVIGEQNADKTSAGPSTITSEWAINYVMYKGSTEHTNNSPVLDTLATMASSSDSATMDLFMDSWDQASLESDSTAVGMAYFEDDSEPNSATSPTALTVVNGETLRVENLNFYDDNKVTDTDYFSFTPSANTIYTVYTDDTRNGALTSLSIFQGSTSNFIIKNDQADGLTTDSTSLVGFETTSTDDIIIQVSRFKSTSRHYGPGNNGYTSTAGKYGSYDLVIEHGGTLGSATTSVSSSSSSSGGGGGGGCLLK